MTTPTRGITRTRLGVFAAACGLTVAVTASLAAGSGPAQAESGSLDSGPGLGGGVAGGSLAEALQLTPDPKDTPFYTEPVELRGEPGRVIRTEPAQLAIDGPLGSLGGTTAATRVMYESVGERGRPIATTGLYIRNNGGGAVAAQRPLAVVAPGTQGQGDQCAPSKTMTTLADVQLGNAVSFGAGYELWSSYQLLQRGFSVFVPDYEGMGTPGLHAYMMRTSQAHTVLDGARAALRLPDSGLAPDAKVTISGHSQGGGATGAAVEEHPGYAPELNVVGAVASAPPADLKGIMSGIDGSSIAVAQAYALNALMEARPELRDRVEAMFNPTGLQWLQRAQTGCIGDGMASSGFSDTRTLTSDGRTLAEHLLGDPELSRAMDDQRLGHQRPEVPVMVVAARHDDAVLYPQAEQLSRDWCARGAAVQMHTDNTPPLLPGTALNHLTPMLDPAGPDYLVDRVAGLPAPTSCGG